MDDTRINLVCGALSAEIAPAIGGSLAAFQAEGLPLLRPELRSGPYRGHPLGMACFPLVPFANRIADGRFQHAGRVITVPQNVTEPHPLHGHGWQSAWRVEASDATSARLVVERDDGSWPWAYQAVQEFSLSPACLAITLTLRNPGAEPFPASLGFHPYFALNAKATLEAQCERIWWHDSTGIPTAPGNTPPACDFGAPREVAGANLDHCFDGWSGQAIVRWPIDDVTVKVAAEDCGCLHLYVPQGGDYFCVEPMTSRPDAFNPRPGDRSGPLIVAPGDSIGITMRLLPAVGPRPIPA